MPDPTLKFYVKFANKEEAEKSLKELEALGVKSVKQIGDEVDRTDQKMQAWGRNLNNLGSNLTRNLTVPIVGLGTAAVVSTMKLFEMEGVTDRMSKRGRSDFYELQEATEGFKDELINTRIEIAEALMPTMTRFTRDVAEPLVETLGKLAQKWGEQSDAVKDAELKTLGVIALAGPLTQWSADVVTAVAAARIAFGALGTAALVATGYVGSLLALVGIGAKGAIDSYIETLKTKASARDLAETMPPGGLNRPSDAERENLTWNPNALGLGLGSWVNSTGGIGMYQKPVEEAFVPRGGGGSKISSSGFIPGDFEGLMFGLSPSENYDFFNDPVVQYNRYKDARAAWGQKYITQPLAQYRFNKIPGELDWGQGGFGPGAFAGTRMGARLGGVYNPPVTPGAPSPWTSDNIWNLAGGVAQGAMSGGGAGAASALFGGIGSMVGGPVGMGIGLVGSLIGMKKNRGETPQEPAYVKVINPSDIATALLNKGFLSAMASINMDTLVQQVHFQNAERNLA